MFEESDSLKFVEQQSLQEVSMQIMQLTKPMLIT
jgi:hypothetical protein